VPHQHRHGATAVHGQEVLNVHRLDQVRSVRVDRRGHAARGEHDLLDRLTGDLDLAAADVERPHVTERDRALGTASQKDESKQEASRHLFVHVG
jgi:hypothetical protein